MPKSSNLSQFPGPETGEEGQESYLPSTVPEGYIIPPNETQFANATWLEAGPELLKLAEELLQYDEFKEIAHLDYEMVWRRKSHPMMGDMPIFASVEIVKPRVVWQTYKRGVERFPRYWIDLHWQHFTDLRSGKRPGEDAPDDPQERSAEYVHPGILQQHLHHALSKLWIDNDILRPRKPDFMGWAETVKRYGTWNEGIARVRQQLALWPDGD